jgi:hypothetical protein
MGNYRSNDSGDYVKLNLDKYFSHQIGGKIFKCGDLDETQSLDATMSGPSILITTDGVPTICWHLSYDNDEKLCIDIGECKKGTICDYVEIYVEIEKILDNNGKKKKILDNIKCVRDNSFNSKVSSKYLLGSKTIHIMCYKIVDKTLNAQAYVKDGKIVERNVEVIGRYDGDTSDLFSIIGL